MFYRGQNTYPKDYQFKSGKYFSSTEVYFILDKNGWTKIYRIIHKDLMDYEKNLILNIIENSGHFIVNDENKTFYSSKIKQQTLERKYIESDYNRSIDNGKSIDILKK